MAKPFGQKLEAKTFDCVGEKANVAVLSRLSGNLPMVEAYRAVKSYNEENGASARIIRPSTVDALIANGHWQFFVGCNYFLTDALIAYDAPGKELGREIVFSLDGKRIVVPTGGFMGEPGIALVAFGLSPDNFKEDGKDIVVSVPSMHALQKFPQKNGWYRCGPVQLLPEGEEVKSLSDAEGEPVRYLWRANGNGAFVGPIVRDIRMEGDCHGIIANYDAFHNFSVVVEVSEAKM